MPSPIQTEPIEETKPIGDSIPKINNELAVGSDLEFQRRWWRWENRIWVLFAMIVVADVLGCFGRGPVAKAHARTSDGTMDITYERIERFSTPSILTVKFGPNAYREGKVQLWVSDSLVVELGNQRIVPQPDTSTLDGHGILYTFASAPHPDTIQFALQPTSPGIYPVTLRMPGAAEFNTKIYVMP
jgi:hypothetical protein